MSYILDCIFKTPGLTESHKISNISQSVLFNKHNCHIFTAVELNGDISLSILLHCFFLIVRVNHCF